MATIKRFYDLEAWKKARALNKEVYKLTRAESFKKDFVLVDQTRRASISIMANLAEGSAMPTKRHRNKYYRTARGSIVEVDSLLELSLSLHYITEEQANVLCDHAARLSYLVTRLIDAA